MKTFLKKIETTLMKLKYYKSVKFKKKVNISRKTILSGNNLIGENTNIRDSVIGFSSYISHNSYMPKTKIGKFCSIGKNVSIIIGSHPTRKYVSTSPLFYSLESTKDFKIKFTKTTKYNEYNYIDDKYFVTIENDVWIGENVSIMQGVRINNGAIIGTNSLVTKDVPPYSIVVGSPAKIIRYRFDEETIKLLLEYKWWNKDIKWIENHSQLFDNIENLIDFIKSVKE